MLDFLLLCFYLKLILCYSCIIYAEKNNNKKKLLKKDFYLKNKTNFQTSSNTYRMPIEPQTINLQIQLRQTILKSYGWPSVKKQKKKNPTKKSIAIESRIPRLRE